MLWIILCSHEWNMSSENNADCLSPAINCCLSIYLANGPLCSILSIHNNTHLYNIFHSFATDFTTNSRLYWTFKYYKIKYSATLSSLFNPALSNDRDKILFIHHQVTYFEGFEQIRFRYYSTKTKLNSFRGKFSG